MASALSHVAVPAVLYASFKSDTVNLRLFLLAVRCSAFSVVGVCGKKC